MNIYWMRNDLRLGYNRVLQKVYEKKEKVIPIFILDDKLLNGKNACKKRNIFLFECLIDISNRLENIGSRLYVLDSDRSYDKYFEEIIKINNKAKLKQKKKFIEKVYTSTDYSRYSINRDKKVRKILEQSRKDNANNQHNKEQDSFYNNQNENTVLFKMTESGAREHVNNYNSKNESINFPELVNGTSYVNNCKDKNKNINKILFKSIKNLVLYDVRDGITNSSGQALKVFTPYKKRVYERLESELNTKKFPEFTYKLKNVFIRLKTSRQLEKGGISVQRGVHTKAQKDTVDKEDQGLINQDLTIFLEKNSVSIQWLKTQVRSFKEDSDREYKLAFRHASQNTRQKDSTSTNNALKILGQKKRIETDETYEAHKNHRTKQIQQGEQSDEKIIGGETMARKVWEKFKREKILDYKNKRDFLDLDYTSKLSAHFKFGTISPYQIALECVKDLDIERNSIEHYLSEVVWRDFYKYILMHFPHVEKGNFNSKYDFLHWQENKTFLEAWKKGRTGYPIIDACMRQLNTTGWMHNRGRMLVASFLTKDLHIHWKKGEMYFQQQLIDYDLSSNNGGWQWAASTGTDASPYFRIFNPIEQGKKFDQKGTFIKKFVIELQNLPEKYIHTPWQMPEEEQKVLNDGTKIIGKVYPKPIVDHAIERKKALEYYKN